MRLYRIAPERFITDLSGQGASYRDGACWNSPGHPVMHFGTSASVAMLEVGNYIPNPRLIPKDYVLGIYEAASSSIETVELDALPDDWDRHPPGQATRQLGTDFLEAGSALILLLPSVAAAGFDQIAVVNPRHPDNGKIFHISTHRQILTLGCSKGFASDHGDGGVRPFAFSISPNPWQVWDENKVSSSGDDKVASSGYNVATS